MRKELVVKKSDLVAMQILMIPRLGAYYVFFALLCLFAGFAGFSSVSKTGYIRWFVMSLAVAAVVFIVILTVSTVIQLLTATAEKGFIGKTIFSCSDDGFREITDGTETLTSWSSIEAVYRSKNYTFVRINGYRIHIIPRREFDSEDDFNCFSEEIYNSWANA